MSELPPILAFQSAVDATVSTAAVAEMFERLPDNGSELVMVDINRFAEVEAVLAEEPEAMLAALLQGGARRFDAAVVTNENDRSERVVLKSRSAHTETVETMPLDMSWPEGVYSLSHVALPTPFDDPLYGGDPDRE